MQEDIESKIKEHFAKFERKECTFEELILEITKIKLCELTIDDVLRHPIKYSKGGITEIIEDVQVINPTALTDKQKKIYKYLLPISAMISAGIWSIPHELIHAGINKATGGTNLEIALNKIYGADLVNAIYPGIQSKLLIPFIGGYVRAEPANDIAEIAMRIAPYAMTPLGIYLMQNALKKQNTTYWIMGAGIMATHLGGIIGDFYSIGRKITDKICTTIYKSPEQMKKDNEQYGVSITDKLAIGAILVGGFILGNRIMGYSYRLSKGLVNSARKYFKK